MANPARTLVAQQTGVTTGEGTLLAAKITEPVPGTFDDPLWVLFEEFSTERPWGPCRWGAIKGATLPVLGAACAVMMPLEGPPTVVWWEGGYAAADGWEPGDLKWSARDSCGEQWLGPCEGQQVSASEYPALAEVLGEAGGMITLPDGRGRVLMGASGTYPLGSTGGEAAVALTVSEMPAHSHGGSTGTGTTGSGETETGTTGEGTTGTESATHTHNYDWIAGGSTLASGSGFVGDVNLNTTTANSTSHTHKVPKLSIPKLKVPGLSVPKLLISSEGAGEAHNNLQPYLVENLFIHV